VNLLPEEKGTVTLALTSEDLFQVKAVRVQPVYRDELTQDDKDLFMAGLAWLVSGVSAFSIARYGAEFSYSNDGYWFEYTTGNSAADDPVEMLRRAARLFVHEALHLVQLGHCTYGRCMMNASCNIAEDVSQPLALCPVCLAKVLGGVARGTSPRDYLQTTASALKKAALHPEHVQALSRLALIEK
jgi:hypothetical protein